MNLPDDFFDQPEKPEKFDRWGRRLLPSPYTGTIVPMTRVTTFAKTIVDSFALNLWQQRMTAKGMALRPDLVAMASTLDVSKDKRVLDDLVTQAKDSAGYKVAANRGTAIHRFTEGVDARSLKVSDIPTSERSDIEAYQECMENKGLSPVPEFIERIICVPQYQVSGQLDRILKESSGQHVIGDVKSGKNVPYNWLEISIQLALYAHGVNMIGLWDTRTQEWTPGPKVRTDYAIVMHVPAGTGTCTLYQVDIDAGWKAAHLCSIVQDWRKKSDLALKYEGPQLTSEVPSEMPAELSTWEERFRSVKTREEASALYQEARRVFPQGTQTLQNLVDLGRHALGMM